ncbi:MAG: alpha/beta hydrolase [Cyanophyceae cyanobacterium]
MVKLVSSDLENLVFSNEPFLLEGADDRSTACLILHGLGGGPFECGLLAPFLNNQGWTVQAIAYPGHDYRPDDGRMPDSRWEEWLVKAIKTYDSLVATYGKVTDNGFSTGCPLALALALRYREAQPGAGVVLMAPFMAIAQPRWIPIPGIAAIANRLLGNLVGEITRGKLSINDAEIRAVAEKACYFKTFNLRAVNSALDLIDTVKPKLGALNQPTLIFQSTQDSVVDPRGAQWIFDSLSSDNKTLHWLEKSGHILPLDCDRDFIFDKIQAFLVDI